MAVSILVSCSGSQPASPLETFQTYMKAFKKKDFTTMKLLLSKKTIEMHEREAKAMGVTVDDIVKNETLFSQDQKTVEFRNQKIDGDKATIEVKGAFGSWTTVPFVNEGGEWKLDKAGFADQMQRDIDDNNKRLDDIINNPTGQPQQTPPM